MVKFFSQSYKYDDPWQTVTLAFFLRYPNPYASHVLSCDVISRTPTPEGTLITTRLILKKGAVPKWFPQKFVNRAESWVVEESEVDVEGRVVRCRTRNLDHVKVMQVHEEVELREAENGTIQKTTASIISNFGWGLTKRIEKYGVTKLKSNLERSREGISLVLSLLRESRSRLGATPLPMGMIMAGASTNGNSPTGTLFDPALYSTSADWAVNNAPETHSRQDDDFKPAHDRENDASSSSPGSTKLGWVMNWLPWRRPPAPSS